MQENFYDPDTASSTGIPLPSELAIYSDSAKRAISAKNRHQNPGRGACTRRTSSEACRRRISSCYRAAQCPEHLEDVHFQPPLGFALKRVEDDLEKCGQDKMRRTSYSPSCTWIAILDLDTIGVSILRLCLHLFRSRTLVKKPLLREPQELVRREVVVLDRLILELWNTMEHQDPRIARPRCCNAWTRWSASQCTVQCVPQHPTKWQCSAPCSMAQWCVVLAVEGAPNQLEFASGTQLFRKRVQMFWLLRAVWWAAWRNQHPWSPRTPPALSPLS